MRHDRSSKLPIDCDEEETMDKRMTVGINWIAAVETK